MNIQKAIIMFFVVFSVESLFIGNCHSARVIDSTSVWSALRNGENVKAFNDAETLVKAADDMIGHYVLGELYFRGAGVEQNYSKAHEHWLKASQKGLPLAQNNLGNMFEEGLGVNRDCKLAFAWYLKSVNPALSSDVKTVELLFSQAPGLYSIGNMYVNGATCLKKDPDRAQYWLEMSAILGLGHAAQLLEKQKNNQSEDMGISIDKWLKTKPENVIETYQLALLMTMFDSPLKVVHVYDGDTILIKGKKSQLVVQLALIDAPELKKEGKHADQPFSKEAKFHLSTLVLNKEVKVKCYDISYNNVFLGLLFIDDLNVNLSMIEAGVAEVSKTNIRGGFDLSPYLRKEVIARKEMKGMWSLEEKYISPAKWRKMQK